MAGVTVMVEVFPVVAPAGTVTGVPLMVKPGVSILLAAIVSAMVVLAVSEPEVPLIVTVVVPADAELDAAKVTTLLPVVGLVPKLAVTPDGKLVADRVTEPLKPLASVTVTVSVALLPCVTETLDDVGASVKLPAALTVSAMVVLAVSEPEVPLIVTVVVPAVAELDAAKVTTLLPVVGFVPKLAVTPAGKLVAAKVTEPLKLLTSVTVTVSLALLPCVTDRVDAAGASVKLPAALTVSAMVVLEVSEPEVPLIVTVVVPADAELDAAKITTELLVVGFVPKLAVTPDGKLDAARVTEPLKPLTSATVTVSVALLPCVTDSVDAVGASVKLPAALTVSATVVLAVSEPEVPVIVTVVVPATAELDAAKVTTLLPVVGFVPKLAVTPDGKLDADRVTEPLKLQSSVTVTVSVALLPCVTDRVDVAGASVKPEDDDVVVLPSGN